MHTVILTTMSLCIAILIVLKVSSIEGQGTIVSSHENAAPFTTCPTLGNCKKDRQTIVSGRKCPADMHSTRPPRPPLDGTGKYKCPSGSAPVVVVLGQSPDGADIFHKFGETKTKSLSGKSMDGVRRGFRTGSGLDPYKSQFILSTTPLFGKPSVLLNKKLVAAYGYIKGRMCIYSNPKLQILINDVVLRNTWNDANSDRWTIDLPCIDHDGSKGENSNPFHGR